MSSFNPDGGTRARAMWAWRPSLAIRWLNRWSPWKRHTATDQHHLSLTDRHTSDSQANPWLIRGVSHARLRERGREGSASSMLSGGTRWCSSCNSASPPPLSEELVLRSSCWINQGCFLFCKFDPSLSLSLSLNLHGLPASDLSGYLYPPLDLSLCHPLPLSIRYPFLHWFRSYISSTWGNFSSDAVFLCRCRGESTKSSFFSRLVSRVGIWNGSSAGEGSSRLRLPHQALVDRR